MAKSKVIELKELSSSSKTKLSPRQIHKLGLTPAQMDKLNEVFMTFEPIGGGTQRSVIFKCKRLTNEMFYAVKIFHLSNEEKENGVPYKILREISILKELDHPNIVKLVDVISSMEDVYVVFEYLNGDLQSFLRSPVMFLYPKVMRNFMHQILSAVSYMHARKIIHRDLNPENVLMHFKSRVVKIADFGSARTFDAPLDSFSQNVGTACYRAPELLFGSGNYSTPNDVWSVGCIFGEMCFRRPLFCGANDRELLGNIFNLLGTPTDETWPGVTALAGDNFDILETPKEPKDLRIVFTDRLDSVGLDLLSKLLCLCPSNRISAEAALDHPYFAGI